MDLSIKNLQHYVEVNRKRDVRTTERAETFSEKIARIRAFLNNKIKEEKSDDTENYENYSITSPCPREIFQNFNQNSNFCTTNQQNEDHVSISERLRKLREYFGQIKEEFGCEDENLENFENFENSLKNGQNKSVNSELFQQNEQPDSHNVPKNSLQPQFTGINSSTQAQYQVSSWQASNYHTGQNIHSSHSSLQSLAAQVDLHTQNQVSVNNSSHASHYLQAQAQHHGIYDSIRPNFPQNAPMPAEITSTALQNSTYGPKSHVTQNTDLSYLNHHREPLRQQIFKANPHVMPAGTFLSSQHAHFELQPNENCFTAQNYSLNNQRAADPVDGMILPSNMLQPVLSQRVSVLSSINLPQHALNLPHLPNLESIPHDPERIPQYCHFVPQIHEKLTNFNGSAITGQPIVSLMPPAAHFGLPHAAKCILNQNIHIAGFDLSNRPQNSAIPVRESLMVSTGHVINSEVPGETPNLENSNRIFESSVPPRIHLQVRSSLYPEYPDVTPSLSTFGSTNSTQSSSISIGQSLALPLDKTTAAHDFEVPIEPEISFRDRVVSHFPLQEGSILTGKLSVIPTEQNSAAEIIGYSNREGFHRSVRTSEPNRPKEKSVLNKQSSAAPSQQRIEYSTSELIRTSRRINEPYKSQECSFLEGQLHSAPLKPANNHVENEEMSQDCSNHQSLYATWSSGDNFSELGQLSQSACSSEPINFSLDKRNDSVEPEHQQRMCRICEKLLPVEESTVHKCMPKCGFCKEYFKDNEKLKTHIFSQHKSQIMELYEKCKICGCSYHDDWVLCKHKKVNFYIPRAKIYICDLDGKMYTQKSRLIFHMDSHKMSNCPICQKELKLSCLKVHLKVSHETKKKFKCSLCPMSFKTVTLRNNHLDRHNKKFECSVCAKNFARKFDLIRHFNYYHSDDPSVQARCKICNKKMLDKSKLKLHMLTHDNTTPKNFECDICGSRFHFLRTIKQHIKRHAEKLQAAICKSARCEICEKSLAVEEFTAHKCLPQCGFCKKYFKDNEKLKTHIFSRHKSQIMELYEKCKICGSSYPDNWVLCKHKKVNFYIPRAKIFICDMDGKICFRKSRIIDHMDSHVIVSCSVCHKELKKCSLISHLKLCNEAEEKFGCNLCPKSFKTAFALNFHLNRHNKKFECSVCAKKFARQFELIRHFNYYHSDDPSVQARCKICNKKMLDKSKLKLHMLTHDSTTPKNFECDICGSRFHFLRTIKQHIKRHAEKLQAAICKSARCEICEKLLQVEEFTVHKCLPQCGFCKEYFRYVNDLRAHIFSQHKNQTLELYEKCKICGCSYADAWEFCEHKKINFEIPITKIYVCDLDGKMYTQKSRLIFHMDSHKMSNCPICQKELKLSCLKFHLKVSHETEKKFKCSLCPMSFKTVTLRNIHLDRHNKKFECSVCAKKFARQFELIRHFNYYHSDDPSVQARCKICNKKMLDKSKLKLHMLTHDKTTPKRFQCDKCGYKAHFLRIIRKHMKSHLLKEKMYAQIKNPIKCSKCPAHLRTQQALRCHMLNVHPKVVHECDLCGRIIRAKSNMMKHIQIHIRNFERSRQAKGAGVVV